MNTAATLFRYDTGIDPAEVAQVTELIGQELRIPAQFNREAGLDAIRHYAHGLGDDNPLWCDEAYAKSGPYQTIVAPPTYYYTAFAPGVTPGFPGLQAFFGTGRWDIKRLARLGERIIPIAKFVGMEEVEGRRAKRMLIQIGETTYCTPDGELLATYVSKAIRAPRANQPDGLKYEPRKPKFWSESELKALGEEILAQTRTGADILTWESVNEGQKIPSRIKGPLNFGSLMAYYAGNLNGVGYLAAEMQWRMRDLALRHPDQVPNNRALGWILEATWPGVGHMDDSVAQNVGMPAAYDNGWNRLGWMGQLITDWIGDDGRLKMLEVRAVAPNIMGDVLWCEGEVTAKHVIDGEHLVDLAIHATNQEGGLSCKGTATVALSSASAKSSSMGLNQNG